MTFYVGQKVECVNDTGQITGVTSCCVVVGHIYTVRKCGEDWVCLQEIVGEPYPNDAGEWAFHRWRFRPVIERKTDISVFTAMLNRKTSTEPVS